MAGHDAGLIPHLSTGKLPLCGFSEVRVKFRAMDDGIKHRIEQRLEQLGLTPRAASLKAGGSPDLIRGLLRGRQTNFRGSNLAKIAEVLGVSVAWLLTGDQDHIPSEDVAATIGNRAENDTIARVNLSNYMGNTPGSVPEVDARAGAGNGSVGEHQVVTLRRGETYVSHKVISEWVFPSPFLRHELHAQPDNVMVLEVVGDSMSPSVEPGDRLIVDTGHSRPVPDGIYVIDEGDGPMVKRLQLVRRSDPPEIRVISDNKNHDAYTMRLDDIRIIGRVSGRITKM